MGRPGVTAADAQAFKRACSCFGLGRYLYRFEETWVHLIGAENWLRFPCCQRGRCHRE